MQLNFLKRQMERVLVVLYLLCGTFSAILFLFMD
jgi:hypothetical protein